MVPDTLRAGGRVTELSLGDEYSAITYLQPSALEERRISLVYVGWNCISKKTKKSREKVLAMKVADL